MKLGLLLALALVGCGSNSIESDPPDPEDGPPVCDRLQQDGEDVLDGPFDADGDGAMDGSNPDCQFAYDSRILDCDDSDPDVNPTAPEVPCNGIDDDCDDTTIDNPDLDGDGFDACNDCDDANTTVNPAGTEECWDDIDNDCDGTVDNGCGPDYNGLFNLTPRVQRTCFGGLIDVNFGSFTVTYDPPQISFTADGSPGQPGNLIGTITGSDFTATNSNVLGTILACDEYYSLSGSFTDEDTFTGVFRMEFQGSACLTCPAQTDIPITGERP